MKALDLFCKAGGVTRGLQLAGFHVTGVDIEKQPRYCGDAFIHADALDVSLDGYDLIWASPPCQRYSAGAAKWGTSEEHPHLIPLVRERLIDADTHFVIENIVPARRHLVDPVMLCGTMFGLGVFRHRLFESTLNLTAPPPSRTYRKDRRREVSHGHGPRWRLFQAGRMEERRGRGMADRNGHRLDDGQRTGRGHSSGVFPLYCGALSTGGR